MGPEPRGWGAVAACVLAAAALAGCTGGGDAGDSAKAATSEPPALQATATTGVIRGVVVDDAIRPLANASVQARGPGGANHTVSTDRDGFFGFTGLAPGTWYVTARKLAHETAQQSVEVAAGVDDPPAVRMLLAAVPGAQPFLTEAKVEAFVQCIVPGANVCAIVNLYPCAVAGYCEPILDDTSYVLYYDPLVALQRPPDWFQTELVWESTQGVSPDLAMLASAHEPADGASRDERQAAARGPSPLVLAWDRSNASAWDMGTKKGVSYEIFGHMEQTSALGSLGFVVNQRVTFFLHGFYGYAPPAGWQFSRDGDVPPPR